MVGLISRVKEAERLERIVSVMLKYELGYFLRKLKLHETNTHKKKELQPNVLVKICEELGGTFVKLGQFLSLRPDLLPHTYSQAFAVLQDAVPPFPSLQAKHRIADALDKPLYQVYAHIDEQPLAAASIGQVHRAKLKSGEQVAVKVMRPGIKETIMLDLLLIYRLASLVEEHLKQEVFEPVRIVDEFRRYTEQELNYLSELQAIQVMQKNSEKLSRIVIPKPYPSLSTEQVLVMEFLPGKSLRSQLRRLGKQRKSAIAHELTYFTLKQVFIDGYFHADLHPGNILLLDKDRLGIIDFGIVGFIDEHTREYLTMLFLSLIDKNLDGVITSMRKLHFFDEEVDIAALEQDLATALGPFYGASVKQVDIASLFLQCLRVAREHQLHVPSDLVLLGKTMVTLKGLVEELDPSFDLLAVARPFISELLQRETNLPSLMKKASQDMVKLHSFITELPDLADEYFQTAQRVDKDLQKIGYQIETFSRDVTLIIRQGVFLFLMLLFGAGAVLARDVAPLVHGISLWSLIAGVFFLFILLSFLRSFFRLRL